MCASPAYLKRARDPTTPRELRKHLRLAFSDAVSAGDWTLLDARGRAHVIDGPCALTADNMQMLLAVALQGEGIA